MTRLSFAVPSKGRLKAQCETFLAEAGFKLVQTGGDRGYRAALKGGPEVDLLLLSAREIAQRLLAGELHLGITGEDLLHDLSRAFDRQVSVLKPLGFGHADVVVAVPAHWIDVTRVADLEDAGQLFRQRHGRRLVVATKYHALTRRFFARMGVSEYRIIDSAGATEAAPAAGSADLIVDITTTGATLKANGLRPLEDGVILSSQAALTAGLGATWTAQARAALAQLLDSMLARATAADQRRLILSKPLQGRGAEDAIKTFALSPIGDGAAMMAMVDRKNAREAARHLSKAGFGPVMIAADDYVYSSDNPLLDTFDTALRHAKENS